MRKKNMTIVRAYHFMAEALIMYLIAIPFLDSFEETILWQFIGVAVFICILFSFYTMVFKTNVWFISSVPLLVFLFFIAGYSLFFSLIFSGLCVWRFIDISHHSILKRESTYIILTLLLSSILTVWYQGIMFIYYFVLTLFITVAGNVWSHLSVIRKSERKGMAHKYIYYIFFAMGMGAIWITLLLKGDHLLPYVSEVIITVFVWVLGIIAKGLALFMPEIHDGFRFEIFNKTKTIQAYFSRDKQHPSTGESILGWVIVMLICTLLGVIIYMTIRHFKRKLLERTMSKAYTSLTYKKMYTGRKNKHWLKHLFGKPPEHRVRKLIYHFEQQAWKLDFGRHPHETLEDWFHRIEAPVDYSTYEKLRYGKKDVTKEEVTLLHHNLNVIVERWKKAK